MWLPPRSSFADPVCGNDGHPQPGTASVRLPENWRPSRSGVRSTVATAPGGGRQALWHHLMIPSLAKSPLELERQTVMASDKRREAREDYHHGNLREALVQAAMSMIAERGLAGFAITELARVVGVSSAAPYRHFRDRTAVIAEVARRGFEQLAANLEAARQAGDIDPVAALERCAQAHLAFAGRDPPVYATMFEATFPTGKHQNVVRAREAAFAVIWKAAQIAVNRGTASDRPPAHMVALHIWSLTHGIADLFISHDCDSRRLLPMQPEELLEAGLMIYVRSLGMIDAADLM